MLPSGGFWLTSPPFCVRGEVIAIDGKALRGAGDKGQSARTRMMVSACAARLCLTLATVAADQGRKLDARLEVPGLIALKEKVVTADALHCNRRTVAAITKSAAAINAWRDPPVRTRCCLTPGPVSASCRQITRSRVRREPGMAARRPATAR